MEGIHAEYKDFSIDSLKSFSLRKTTRKLQVMGHLFIRGGNGEEFSRYPLEFIRKTF